MKAKLIKTKDGFYVLNDEFGNYIHGKLSLKNCQAIERGYDLKELAEEWVFETNGHKWSNNDNTAGDNYGSFKAGFQKALELMGDKKFSEEDVKNLIDNIHSIYEDGFGVSTDDKKQRAYKLIQSLQQSEWNVEIVEVRQRCHLSIGDWVSEDENGEFPMSINGAFGYRYIPKLDAEGCLILKLK